MTVGSRPNYSSPSLQTITYDYDIAVGTIVKTEGAGSGEIIPPHWELLETSTITATKWELAFYRTDIDVLGLKTGKKITAYMAILEN